MIICTVYSLLDSRPRIKSTLHMMGTFLQIFRVSFDIAFDAVNSFAAQLHSNSAWLVPWLAHIITDFTADLYARRMTELAFSGNFCKEDFFSNDCCIRNFISTALNKAWTCSRLL